ncbi:MAG: hypothetical protein N4A62_07450 [Marinisporobacter sp.]|jgi:hypothetical protein|nr:hypothetical protein [Marinisporobacter sp.]
MLFVKVKSCWSEYVSINKRCLYFEKYVYDSFDEVDIKKYKKYLYNYRYYKKRRDAYVKILKKYYNI